ncbi:MAG: primosomal protein N', partial [Lysobacterales bacterium CG_4_9_14_3_um_filter_62_6]
AATGAELAPGVRVRVPLGHRQLLGVVVRSARSTLAPTRLRAITEVLDAHSWFAPELFASLVWAAGYWQYPLGEVFAAALPQQLRSATGSSRSGDGFAVRLSGKPQSAAALRAGSAPQALFALLQTGAKRWADIVSSLPNARSALRRLEQLALVERFALDDAPRAALIAAPPLNPAQQTAIASVRAALGTEQAFLLEGVTGSGKTEVYLALIESVLARGQQALVLVPEIGLTPQLLNRFRERLPAPVLALHSALSAGQRSRTWQRVRSATPLVLIGTRSAVFAPFAALGLVVVDEEHDPSFKQQEGFRYHARDLALVRAQRLRIPVLMGSATPALESLHNVALGRYQRLSLPARAGFAKPPTVQLLDLRRATLDEGLSAPALQAIGEHLERGEQVLVFKNRRGFAPVLQCRSCGWHAECDRCDRPYTWHRRKHRLVCHHCGRERPVPAVCPVCGDTPSALGIGTERLEDFLRQRFPAVPVIRVDRDSAGGSGGMEKLLAPAYAGASCLLVGTQILAKGHDLPKLTLALIVDADQGLFSQDFRSGERMAQLIVQVAGRSGRSHQAGRVLIQTHHPEHPLFTQLLQGGYAAFAEAELALRSSLSFPPFAALALLSAEAGDESPLRAFFAAARTGLDADPALQILGPMPGPVPRRAGQTRWQMLLQMPQRKQLQQILPRFTEHLYAINEGKRVRWSLDVDPLDFA